jgi:polysaccharide pyruvyl transferase WcaK-like protein
MGKVILKGYYGKGNLGDDVLMINTYHLVRKLLPKCEIVICSDGHQSSYIKNLLGEIEIVKSNTPLEVDWVFHGGGGVYFDFKKGGFKFTILNFLIRLISYQAYRAVYRRVQGWRNNLGVIHKRRIGWGIGIGTYTSSSQKFYSDILSLSDFDYLIVRDAASVVNLKKFNFQYPIKVATDIAFLEDFWNPKFIRSKKNGAGKSIGFILRDWPLDGHYHLKVLYDVAIKLKSLGYQLTIFSLDRFEDKYYTEFFSKFRFISWDPFKKELNDFITNLAEVDLVVSSRAHGCILSACLGIPSVCIGIEPKLQSVAEMLKTSAVYVPQPFKFDDIIQKICKALENVEQAEAAVFEDVKNNRTIINKEINRFSEYLKQLEPEDTDGNDR